MDHMKEEFLTEEYTENVIDHFMDPKNVGEIDDPDVKVRIGDPDCGDYIELFLKVAEGRIADIKYLVFGCIGAIATSSALSEMVMGKTVEEALEITDDDVVAYLGGIPEKKKHCSLLGVRGLQAAVKKYRGLESDD